LSPPADDVSGAAYPQNRLSKIGPIGRRRSRTSGKPEINLLTRVLLAIRAADAVTRAAFKGQSHHRNLRAP
jgi:hypothetical protein